jgi:Flp pilus assembly protein TadG
MFTRTALIPNSRKRAGKDSGQALMEFALCASILFIILFGVIDVSRALFVGQIIVNLTGEGCALASRGTTLSDTATAVMTASAPLTFTTNGRVIVSSVYNNNNVLKLTGQSALGGLAATSRIGSSIGGTVTLPTNATPQIGQTVFITEVFYTYHSITPVGSFLNATVVPSQLYDVGYY